MNAINILPIIVDVTNLVEHIFWPEIGALKGKVTRSKLAPVISDYIEVPSELVDRHHNIILCIDTIIFFCIDTIRMNGLYF